jgi:hypothetical protein
MASWPCANHLGASTASLPDGPSPWRVAACVRGAGTATSWPAAPTPAQVAIAGRGSGAWHHALDGVSRDQGPLAGVKPSHSAGEAHSLDRLDPVSLGRFADDENRRFVVARQAVEAQKAGPGHDGVSATAFTSGYAGSIQPGLMWACA